MAEDASGSGSALAGLSARAGTSNASSRSKRRPAGGARLAAMGKERAWAERRMERIEWFALPPTLGSGEGGRGSWGGEDGDGWREGERTGCWVYREQCDGSFCRKYSCLSWLQQGTKKARFAPRFLVTFWVLFSFTQVK